MSDSIVILSSYQFTAVALTQKLSEGLVHLSFAQGGQVKCRPKKKVIVLWPKGQCVLGGEVQKPSGMTGISAISLI